MDQPLDANGKPYRRGLLVLTLLLGTFTTFITQTILTTAMPTLMSSFHITASYVQWLTTGFMLVTGIMIPISAWLLNKFNVKYLYLTAMGIFLVGTLLSRFAWSFPVLLAGRLIESTGVGLSAPTFQNVMYAIYPPSRRGSAMGLAGLVIGLAPAIGPTLSGYILLNHSWRALFTMLLPIIMLVILMGILTMRKVLPTSNPRIDVVSVVESTIGFGALLYGFSEVGTRGWLDSVVLGSLTLGAFVVAAFTYRQLHMSQPLLELRVFRSKTFTLSVILTAVSYMSMVGVEMVLPMYIQTIRGQSAFSSGLILLPGTIMMGIMSPITGRIFDRIGAKRLATTGLFLLLFGTLPLVALNADSPLLFVAILYAIRMFGITMVTMPVTTAGMNTLPTELIAHGTAVNNTVRQIAAAIGTVIMVSVLSTVTLARTPAIGLQGSAPIAYARSLQAATVAGYRAAFAISLVLCLCGYLLSLQLKADAMDGGKN